MIGAFCIKMLIYRGPLAMATFCFVSIGTLVVAVGPSVALLALVCALTYAVVKSKHSIAVFEGRESMQGKTVLVTGAARGIGRQTAKELARRGARVIIADVDETLAKRTASEIFESTNNPKVEARFLDLGSFDNVRKFAKMFLEQEDRLDVLVNNAGVVNLADPVTPDGIDRHYAVNYLGPFLLTNLLLPLLRRSVPSRVVVVSSLLHVQGDVERPMKNGFRWRRNADPNTIYNDSKLACILFVVELSRRLRNTGVTANALHPGLVFTKICQEFPSWKRLSYRILCLLFFKNEWQGAQTSLYLAVSDQVAGVSGKYFVDCREADAAACCADQRLSERLWNVSEKVTGMNEPRGANGILTRKAETNIERTDFRNPLLNSA